MSQYESHHQADSQCSHQPRKWKSTEAWYCRDRQQVQQRGAAPDLCWGTQIKRTSGVALPPETRRAARPLKPLVICWQCLPNLQAIKHPYSWGGLSSSLMTSQSGVSWFHLLEGKEETSENLHSPEDLCSNKPEMIGCMTTTFWPLHTKQANEITSLLVESVRCPLVKK